MNEIYVNYARNNRISFFLTEVIVLANINVNKSLSMNPMRKSKEILDLLNCMEFNMSSLYCCSTFAVQRNFIFHIFLLCQTGKTIPVRWTGKLLYVKWSSYNNMDIMRWTNPNRSKLAINIDRLCSLLPRSSIIVSATNVIKWIEK